jgi:outer membrane protein assembly complex protein YaeT
LVAALSVPAAAQNGGGLVVRKLAFTGNRAIDEWTLSTVIATTRSGWFARNALVRWLGLGEKRYLDEVEFKRDVIRLRLFYRQSGYMQAVIDTSVRRTPKDVFITFRIHEGEPVRVRKFDLIGFDSVLNIEKRRRDLPLHVGDPFNRFLFQASADTILNWLRNVGYPYAELFRSLDANAATLEADLALEVVPGVHARVDSVEIEGLKKLDQGAVRGMLSVRPGEVFQQDKLYQSQRDLYAMGVFRFANVVLVDSLPPENPADTMVHVRVLADEGPRHRLRTGFGFASAECLRFQAGWTAFGFLGSARAFDLTGRLARVGFGPTSSGLHEKLCSYVQNDAISNKVSYSLTATLRQPVFFSPRHNASLSVFAERRTEVNVFTREAVGTNLAVTLNARRAVPVTLAYGYSFGQTTASDLTFCSAFRACTVTDRNALRDRRGFAALSLTAVRDRTNSPLDPSRGSVVTLAVAHASRLIRSDSAYQFNRGELEVIRYHPIGRSTVFAWRLKLGTILPETFALSGQAARYVPPDARFYAGGPNTVRGFRLNDLGPRVYLTSDTTDFDPGPAATGDTLYRDVAAAATGGNALFLANAELRLPAPPFLPQRVRFGLFVDVGQLYERQQTFVTLKNIRITPGVGLRITTPLGPVRLDAAYNGYAPEPGTLFFQDTTSGSLVEHRSSYPKTPTAPHGFWNRIVLQFAIGQAY